MKFSIRTRLTLWYVTLLAVSLIIFGTMLYFLLFKVFTDNVDDQIDSVAGMMVHTVIGPKGQLIIPRNFDIILERFFGIRTTGNYIQILDRKGRVRAKSTSLEGFILPLTEEALQNAVKNKPTYEVVDTIGRYPVRTVTRPVQLKGKGLVAIIQVGSSLELMEEVSRFIVYVFFIGGIISVIVASIGGRVLARAALKPVDDITTMARRIGAEDLHERLSVSGPKDEIGRLTETINEMIARLEASFAQIKQFTGDASHELRTPLTVLKGEIEVALRGAPDERAAREVLESALEEIDRMSYIVNNLLELAKADVGAQLPPVEAVYLDRVVESTSEMLRNVAEERGLSFELSKNERVMVSGDEVRFGQLVFNLIDNAIKYTDKGGSVTVSLASEDNDAVLKVRDTGIGVPADDLPHIFDRFYRVDKARSREVGGAGGAGLGLSICKEIAESAGGTISVESEPGKGTEFIVRCPKKS